MDFGSQGRTRQQSNRPTKIRSIAVLSRKTRHQFRPSLDVLSNRIAPTGMDIFMGGVYAAAVSISEPPPPPTNPYANPDYAATHASQLGMHLDIPANVTYSSHVAETNPMQPQPIGTSIGL